jgi:SAM-dependent methyltransferase
MGAVRDILTSDAAILARIYRSELPGQMVLHEIRRAVGRTENARCLEIGSDSGMFIHHLRLGGGEWLSLASDAEAMARVGVFIADGLGVLGKDGFPYDDKEFDFLVVTNVLECVEDDVAFVQECHRVLKPNGRLVLCARHAKRRTPIGLLRRWLGVDGAGIGRARDGYGEKALFELLKNGYDVVALRSFSRFLVELVDAFVQARLRRLRRVGDPGRRGESRLYATAGILYRIAFQLDALFFLTRGHRWVAVGKRRMWRERQTPILSDGRPISEAVLSKLK